MVSIIAGLGFAQGNSQISNGQNPANNFHDEEAALEIVKSN